MVYLCETRVFKLKKFDVIDTIGIIYRSLVLLNTCQRGSREPCEVLASFCLVSRVYHTDKSNLGNLNIPIITTLLVLGSC